MPRKTRILHEDDEYLFVEAPGDPQGPALQLFAKVENARAVTPGRTPTHKTEHGAWLQVARFDGAELALDPDAPAGLGERLKQLLPRYAEVRQKRIAEAKHPCWWISAEGKPLHGLHPAQPAGVLFKLWSSVERARAVGGELGVEAQPRSTGELREFLELRAEEGYAGALLDDVQFIFFCLDSEGRMQFLRLGDGSELATHLLSGNGKFELYEGDEELDPWVDADGWDRLLVRTYGVVPFLGHQRGWRCFALHQAGQPIARPSRDGASKQPELALFHDPAAADVHCARHNLGKATIERVEDVIATVRAAQSRGELIRLHPEDHRVRGGPLWVGQDGALYLLGFSGIWRSADGEDFERVADDDANEGDADGQSSGNT
ncbi:MAG: hypothetical protein EXS13_00715 [Planctomycetes bacterium]|nr:hypothetical protein [Planctomycetota bacterium]